MKQSTLIALIGGALVGAAAALLLAPDSGANTRRKIKEKAAEEYGALKERIRKGQCDCGAEDCNPENAAE